MTWPGENLIIKLWESLADKGVGCLLKPWQTRREGAAQIDVRCREILALAEAEKMAEGIRSGKYTLPDVRYAIPLTQNLIDSNKSTHALKNSAIHVVTQSIVADSLRKEINVAKAITHAENELKNDQAEVARDEIETDWLYRWRDYAGEVSSEELQTIWGRILAGEVKSPGTYSYRLLEFIKNLSRNEALLIEKISSLVLTDFIARNPDSALEDEGISFSTLLDLQELGVVAGVEALGLTKQFPSSSPDSFMKILCCHGRGIVIKHSDPKKKLDIGAYVVTALGRQVFQLGNFKASEKYLNSVALEISKNGFDVSLCDYVPAGKNQVKYFNVKAISQKT